jgi:hypothetical protein
LVVRALHLLLLLEFLLFLLHRSGSGSACV